MTLGVRIKKRLEKKCKIRSKSFDIVIEELKQDIKAATPKIKWFKGKNKQYREKRMLVNSQRQFYWSLETKFGDMDIAPDKQEIEQLYESIWSVEARHNL